jgi:hypothetical protein
VASNYVRRFAAEGSDPDPAGVHEDNRVRPSPLSTTKGRREGPRSGRAVAEHSSGLDDAQRGGVAIMMAMRPARNWIWALGVLVLWVSILFAFLLISISRP